MRKILIGGCLTLACASTAWAQSLSDRATNEVVNQWVSIPDGDDMLRVYPRAALKSNLNGAATLECGVLANGRLADCTVSSEVPSSQGFGEAALKLAGKFRMKAKLSDGSSPDGSHVTIPIIFRMN